MKSNVVGKSISKVEILNISPYGVWLIAREREYFLPYSEFPWFEEKTISEIFNVKLMHGHHLYWPEIDVDIDLESLRNIEQYPLVYKKT